MEQLDFPTCDECRKSIYNGGVHYGGRFYCEDCGKAYLIEQSPDWVDEYVEKHRAAFLLWNGGSGSKEDWTEFCACSSDFMDFVKEMVG